MFNKGNGIVLKITKKDLTCLKLNKTSIIFHCTQFDTSTVISYKCCHFKILIYSWKIKEVKFLAFSFFLLDKWNKCLIIKNGDNCYFWVFCFSEWSLEGLISEYDAFQSFCWIITLFFYYLTRSNKDYLFI